MEEVSSRRYADEMVSTSHKSARPKSAFRRRVAVDRDLDMTEGESFEASDDRELLGDIINVDEIAYDLLPDEFTSKQFAQKIVNLMNTCFPIETRICLTTHFLYYICRIDAKSKVIHVFHFPSAFFHGSIERWRGQCHRSRIY